MQPKYKERIRFSTFSITLTVVVTILLAFGCWYTRDNTPTWVTLLVVDAGLLVSALLYGPWYIAVDDDSLILGSVLRKRRIPLTDIESVKPLAPTMGAIRVFGSGGYWGYWGIFSEGDIGRFSAFYGRASDCLLVRLHSGEKFLIACPNPDLPEILRSATNPS